MSRLAHAVCFLGVAGHARLGQDVFAGVECRASDFAMQIGPRADHDRIDLGIVEQRVPMRIHAGDLKFLGDAGRRLGAAINDADEIDAGDLPETGDVPEPRIATRTDDPNPHALRDHAAFLMTRRVAKQATLSLTPSAHDRVHEL